jgi:hypothetical protein
MATGPVRGIAGRWSRPTKVAPPKLSKFIAVMDSRHPGDKSRKGSSRDRPRLIDVVVNRHAWAGPVTLAG